MTTREVPTFGVEEELLLLDPSTGVPVMRNREVADRAASLGLDVQLELTPCQIETSTPVLHTADELLAQLHRSRSLAASAARACGAAVLAAGVPPILPTSGPITDTVRYRHIAAEYGIIAAEQGVCGAHVHVGVPDRATAMHVGNHLRPWLPVLLALTANSAFYDGHDTGYASWRSVLWSRWPSAGPPPFVRSPEHYAQLLAQMKDVGAILDDGMVYWDVRPSVRFPTVEVRVSDVPADTADTVLLAVLVRALVMTALRAIDDDVAPPDTTDHALRWAYWRAGRSGLRSTLVHPLTGRSAPADAVIDSLCSHVADALAASADSAWVQAQVNRLRTRGSGADRQRRARAATGSIAAAVVSLIERP